MFVYIQIMMKCEFIHRP